MNECFYVFRIIISCVFVYLDSIKVSHSFYDAKIEITFIAYIIFSSKCCIFVVQTFSQIQCKHSALVGTSTNANIVQTSKNLLQNKNRF